MTTEEQQDETQDDEDPMADEPTVEEVGYDQVEELDAKGEEE